MVPGHRRDRVPVDRGLCDRQLRERRDGNNRSPFGVRWCDILARGIRVYGNNGFGGEWRKHHQGGPMGYEGRDFKATPTEKRKVVRNQLVGWNPSITGTKSEDTILSSGEVLTPTPHWPRCGTRPDILCRG